LAGLSDDKPGPSNDLPILPDDRSQFEVHSALEDDEVKKIRIHMMYMITAILISTILIISIM
jgi:hypothetical protein